MRIALFILTFLFAIDLFAQRKALDYVASCGLPAKGLYLPLVQDSVYSKTENFVSPDDIKRIVLQADMICNNGEALPLLKWLNEHPLTKLEISYHTDQNGDAGVNKKTSQICANNIRKNLIELGIEPSRLTAIGKGEEEFLIPESEIKKMKSREEQLKAYRINRRLEIKILEINYKFWFGISDPQFFPGQILDPALSEQFNRQYNYIFDTNHKNPEAATHRDTAFRVLNILAVFLQTHPAITIEIGVYTDSRGDQHYNTELTRKRADALVKNLIGKGVSPKQLLAKGYGESAALHSEAELMTEKNPEKREALANRSKKVVFKIQQNGSKN